MKTDGVKPEIRNILDDFPVISWEQMLPNPLFSDFSGQCIERGRDLYRGGGTHYHYGCHGADSSTAADSLAAVRKFVYEEKNVFPERLLRALETDYREDDELRLLMKQGPKTGDNDPASNEMLNR